MVNHTKKYNWKQIQVDYDSGLSYRDISSKYSMSQQSIANAKKRGDIVTRTNSESTKIRIAKYGPNKMGQEARERTSARMSENNPGGRSKWFEVAGRKVQGTWERDFADYLEQKQIPWQRGNPLVYHLDGKCKRYSPDFYLPLQDVFVEIKGYWWGNDRKKMDAVIEQHQDKTFYIVEHTEFDKLELW